MVRVKTKEEQLEEQLEHKERMQETIQRIRRDLDRDKLIEIMTDAVYDKACWPECGCCPPYAPNAKSIKRSLEHFAPVLIALDISVEELQLDEYPIRE